MGKELRVESLVTHQGPWNVPWSLARTPHLSTGYCSAQSQQSSSESSSQPSSSQHSTSLDWILLSSVPAKLQPVIQPAKLQPALSTMAQWLYQCLRAPTSVLQLFWLFSLYSCVVSVAGLCKSVTLLCNTAFPPLVVKVGHNTLSTLLQGMSPNTLSTLLHATTLNYTASSINPSSDVLRSSYNFTRLMLFQKRVKEVGTQELDRVGQTFSYPFFKFHKQNEYRKKINFNICWSSL